MKRIIVVCMTLTLAVSAVGCREKEGAAEGNEQQKVQDIVSKEPVLYEAPDNDFLENASPETSALAFYKYDGAEVHREFLFGTNEVEKAVKELSDVGVRQAPDWTPEQVTLPVYGVDIGGKDGYTIFGVWSNGYWITGEGEAYEYDYDFKELAENYKWESPDSFSSLNVLPCARHLMLHDDKWYPQMMTPASEKHAPEGISLTIIEQTTEKLTAEITNDSGGEWFFGEYFSLEVQVDDAWYQVPATPGNWAFTDIGLILPAGESMEMDYHLMMYGELPMGTYRLVVEEMTAEFAAE